MAASIQQMARSITGPRASMIRDSGVNARTLSREEYDRLEAAKAKAAKEEKRELKRKRREEIFPSPPGWNPFAPQARVLFPVADEPETARPVPERETKRIKREVVVADDGKVIKQESPEPEDEGVEIMPQCLKPATRTFDGRLVKQESPEPEAKEWKLVPEWVKPAGVTFDGKVVKAESEDDW
ncbi:hypothetical protein M409DRAFT_54942 [Zasmidium cellare ATCC 36951]|uniref:Uncharacterized protein n=1 Tax=Zasmidium cellare ATCC 36951 TaxID=1080233 RepID=A0A6A6CHE7_ZASCE|nr:uncharacterized protein M409DRAFT_54942 [Zasmidium cellare ATCC 36951]KAF2166614.1 hypothetical protein M409DRAFT_54942 [Zasmidium cellare ATCC 36951]